MKQRKQERGDEARRIVEKLTAPGVMLAEKERAFVLSVGQKLKRTDWVSGKQLAWLRALELRHWGAGELERAVGKD